MIRLIFDLFERLGTVNGCCVSWLTTTSSSACGCARARPAGSLQWRRPSRATLQNILRNPAYAGIYVYGRSTTDPRRRQAGRPFTGRVRTAREDWAVFLPGLLPGYISIGQYEKNRQRMEANRSWSQGMGVVRNGPALLAGLVACGRCGQKMTVRYHRGPGGDLRPVYVCAREKADHGAGQCQQLAGSCVDAYVTGLMLDALAPAALEVSLAAAGQAEARRAQVNQIWRQRLERAGFAADRARRQYQLTEPENRLVARQLEKEWEAALAERQRLGEEYDRFTASRPRALTPAERSQIRALAADIPAIWHAPTTTDADRKQLIRHLVERVQVTVTRHQRKGRSAGDLGRRAPHHRTDHPPGGQPHPAQLLPPARRTGPRTGTRRANPCTDRRPAHHRRIPATQTLRGLHRRRGQRPAARRRRPAPPQPRPPPGPGRA